MVILEAQNFERCCLGACILVESIQSQRACETTKDAPFAVCPFPLSTLLQAVSSGLSNDRENRSSEEERRAEIVLRNLRESQILLLSARTRFRREPSNRSRGLLKVWSTGRGRSELYRSFRAETTVCEIQEIEIASRERPSLLPIWSGCAIDVPGRRSTLFLQDRSRASSSHLEFLIAKLCESLFSYPHESPSPVFDPGR